MQHYAYVGPSHILERVRGEPGGTAIRSQTDLIPWLHSQSQSDGLCTATFTIDADGTLRVADRHSEHVACASGGPVLSAGEVTFELDGDEAWVVAITNQSTGFCPEPTSWQAVRRALEAGDIEHPGRFTLEFQFRRCPSCGQINVVKDAWFECGVCEADLPASWNFHEPYKPDDQRQSE